MTREWEQRRRLRALAGFTLMLLGLWLAARLVDLSQDNRRLTRDTIEQNRRQAAREEEAAERLRVVLDVVTALQTQVRDFGGRPVEIPADVLDRIERATSPGASGPPGPRGPTGPAGPAASSTVTSSPGTTTTTTTGPAGTTTTTRPAGPTTSTSTSSSSTTTTTRGCPIGILGICLVR